MAITRRRFISAASIAGFSATFPMGAFAQAKAKGATLRVMAQAALKVLDPVWTSAAITLEHGYLVYDKLFEPDLNGVPQFQMAEAHEISQDQLTHEITLRDGLKFHDGAPVTAEDVVMSLTRWGKKDVTGQLLFETTEKLEAVNDKTVRFKLKSPFPSMRLALSKLRGNPPFIMPKRVAATPHNEQLTDATGSGPFVFRADQWRSGSLAVYEKAATYTPRNEPTSGYAGGKHVHFNRIEFVYIPDSNTALNAISSGDTDIWELLPNDLAPLIDSARDVELAKGMLASGMFGVNHLYAPFNHPKAREALLYLIDQEEMLMTVTGDPRFFKSCKTFFNCGGPYGAEIPAFAGWKADINKAKQLFKEAGYDGRKVVVLDTTDIATLHASSLYLAQQLRRAGINVDLQPMDWSTTISRYPLRKAPEEGGWSIYSTYSAAVEQSSPFGHRYIVTGEKAQPGWPDDAKLEELRVAWLAATTEQERLDLAAKIQARAFETVPYVPWGEFYTARANRTEIKGFYSEAPVPVYWGIERKS